MMDNGFFKTSVVMMAAFALSSCGGGGVAIPDDPQVLAVYDGGVVSIHDLDEAILALPPSQRRVEADKSLERDRQLLEWMVLERLLLERAEAGHVRQNPAFAGPHEENRQRVVAEFFIDSEFDSNSGVTEDEVRTYFDDHRAEFRQAAQRHMQNIFLRVSPGSSVDDVVDTAEDLRLRVLRGESFGALAREYSDSETAERAGDLGWLSEDSIPPALADVIFDLEPSVPSEPVVTAEGVHLFLVVSASPAREYKYDEVKSKIRSFLVTQRRQVFVTELMEELPLPQPFVAPSDEDLEFLFTSGDQTAEVFLVGEISLTVARFRTLVDQSTRNTGVVQSADQTRDLLEALIQRARIYTHCEAEGIFEDPILSSRLDKLYRDDVISFMREKEIAEDVRADQKALGDYYSTHMQRFSSPLLVDVGILSVPMADHDPNQTVEALRVLSVQRDARRLENAAAAFGGTVDRIENAPLSRIHQWSPKIARLVSTLEIGRCSQPVRIGPSIVVVEVTSRTEPEPTPFEAVQDAVVRAYVDDHRRDLYQQWSDRILEGAGFVVLDDRLAAFSEQDRSVEPHRAVAGNEAG